MENAQALTLLQSILSQGSQGRVGEISPAEVAKNGDINTLVKLHANGKFQINDKFDGKSLLHIACEFGHQIIVGWLIQEGAELLEPDLNGDLPFHIAVLHGHIAIFVLFLRYGLDHNCLNSKMQTLMHIVATTGFINIASLLFHQGIDVTLQDVEENTALHLAIKHNQFAMAKFLINQNSPLILTNKDGLNVFETIVAEDKPKFLEYLIEAKGNRDLVNGSSENDQSLLHFAVIHNSGLCCTTLCENALTDLNKRDKNGQSVLHLCIDKEREKIMQDLLSIEDVNVNACDKDGETALHKALRDISNLPLENPSRVKLIAMATDLVHFGADLHQRNSSGKNAMDLLCSDETLKETILSSRREYEQTTIVRHFQKNLIEAANKRKKESREIHIGDFVEFHMSLEEIQRLQNGHGGFIAAMQQCLNRQGIVQEFDKDGDVIVLFDNRKQFIFNPKLLVKTGSIFDPVKINVGDLIRVESDEEKLKSIQENSSGGYQENMKSCIGKIGYVQSIEEDGSVSTRHGPSKWKWNPQNIHRLTEEEFQDLKISNQGNQDFAINDLVLIECNLLRAQRIQKENWDIDMESCLGKFGYVKKVKKQKLIHVKVLGKTLEFEPKLLTLIVPAKDTNDIVASEESKEEIRIDAGQLLQLLQSLISSAGEQGESSSAGGEGGSSSSSQVPAISSDAASGLLQNLLANLLQQGGGGGGMLMHASEQEIVEAIEKGQVAILKQKLAEKAFQVNDKVNGKSLLEIACEKGKFSVVDWLIKEKCDINVTDQQGNTPLHIATINSHPSVLTPLVKAGLLMETVNKSGKTPLHSCANKKGSARILKVACDKSKEAINMQDNNGETPLHLAIDGKCLDEAKVLVDKKAVLHLSNKRGFNCLHAMVKNNMHELLKYIIEKNAQTVGETINDLTTNNNETALHIAVSSGSVECVEELLKFETIDLNKEDGKGQTALFYAINRQSEVGEKIAKMLESKIETATESEQVTATATATKTETATQ